MLSAINNDWDINENDSIIDTYLKLKIKISDK